MYKTKPIITTVIVPLGIVIFIVWVSKIVGCGNGERWRGLNDIVAEKSSIYSVDTRQLDWIEYSNSPDQYVLLHQRCSRHPK